MNLDGAKRVCYWNEGKGGMMHISLVHSCIECGNTFAITMQEILVLSSVKFHTNNSLKLII